MTTIERILQSSGLESGVSAIAAREMGITSDTERPVIGSTVGGAKFIRTEEVVTIITTAPAAFTIRRRSRCLCFVDTNTAGGNVAIDITAGAQVAGSIISFYVTGPAGRLCSVTYSGSSVDTIPTGYTQDFVWSGTAWVRLAPSYLSDLATRGYIDGLICSNATDTDHDISIAAGSAKDSTNAYLLTLASALVKQIDASWAVGTNAGGLDTGSVATSTVYYIWLIRKDSDGTIDALFSLSKTAPTMPTGYTYKRRIMTVCTDGSANIRNFDQYGSDVRYRTPIQDRASAVIAGTSRIAYAVSVPPNMDGYFNFIAVNTAGDNLYYIWFGSANRVDAAASATYLDALPRTSNTRISVPLKIIADASRNIYARGSNVAIDLTIITLGWTDDRGRDA